MKKRILKLLCCVTALITLCGCDGTSVKRTKDVTDKITQTAVIKKTKITENEDFAEFFTSFKSDFLTPGLMEGIIPQGMCFDETTGYFLISGYYEDGELPSMIMAIDSNTGKLVGAYPLKTTNGDDYFGHAGGIASSQNTVYLTSGGECYTIPSVDIKNHQNGTPLHFKGKFKLNTAGSFACIHNNILWTGDFIESSAEGRESASNITTLTTGETFYAYCEGYLLSDGLPDTKKINSESNGYIPDYMIAIPEQVQGMAFTKSEKIIFSTSYGRKNNSKIYIFDDILVNEKVDTITIDNKSIDVLSCSNDYLLKEITAPPMAEGLANTSDGIYMLFESGASKYRSHGGKHPVENVYFTTIE